MLIIKPEEADFSIRPDSPPIDAKLKFILDPWR
jgi:hypothetical protein